MPPTDRVRDEDSIYYASCSRRISTAHIRSFISANFTRLLLTRESALLFMSAIRLSFLSPSASPTHNVPRYFPKLHLWTLVPRRIYVLQQIPWLKARSMLPHSWETRRYPYASRVQKVHRRKDGYVEARRDDDYVGEV